MILIALAMILGSVLLAMLLMLALFLIDPGEDDYRYRNHTWWNEDDDE